MYRLRISYVDMKKENNPFFTRLVPEVGYFQTFEGARTSAKRQTPPFGAKEFFVEIITYDEIGNPTHYQQLED